MRLGSPFYHIRVFWTTGFRFSLVHDCISDLCGTTGSESLPFCAFVGLDANDVQANSLTLMGKEGDVYVGLYQP